MHVELTLDAACDGGKDNPRLASETFGAAVDQGLQAVEVVPIHHADQRSVDPSSCFNTVEPADNKVELHVVILVLVLNLAAVWSDLYSSHAAFDEARSHIGFVGSNIGLAEEELAIQVGYVDRVCWLFSMDQVDGERGLGAPISMTSMFLNPDRARFLRISHPRPPAPLGKVRTACETEVGLYKHDSVTS